MQLFESCRRAAFVAGVAGVAAAACGCTTTGTAEGALVAPVAGEDVEPVGGVDVVFRWESSRLRPQRGEISTVLPDGTRFTGNYVQITKTAREEAFGPMWHGGDPYWGMHDLASDVTFHSGRVVADLMSSEGERMRCHFTLAEPERGMAGGGEGDCMLQGGQRITNVVLGED